MKNKWFKILIWAILIGAVIWAGKGIFKYSIFSTHDGDHHIARVFDAVAALKAGEFPLRWSGSLNYFCGVPIYNFYYPLIYYLTAGINFLTNNVIFSLKIVYFLALLSGTLSFYLWAKEETNKTLPALGGALVYLYAPYRFLLIFVRGSPEFLAYAILPIVLYFYTKSFNTTGKKFIVNLFLAALFGGLLTISHNFTVMFMMPIILAYLALKVYVNKVKLKNILWVAFSFVSSLGLGAFFLGPALLEQKFTRIGSNFLMWQEHFPELWQLWNSKWGYFYSSLGTMNDNMSFMLGYAQWLILGLSSVFLLIRFIKQKRGIGTFIRDNIWILFFFLGSIVTIYLILPWSIPVWEIIKPLQQIQFSWRLLGVAVFTISALFVFVLDKIKPKYLLLGLTLGVSLFAFVAERNHLLPQPVSNEDVYRYDDYEKLHPHRHSTTTLGDEVIAPSAQKACWFGDPVIKSDKDGDILAETVDRTNISGFVKFEIDSDNQTDEMLIMNLSYFPGIYKLNLNGNDLKEYSDCQGLVCFRKGLTVQGANFISWKIGENTTERLFDWISLAFLVIWILILIGPRKIKPHLPLIAIFIVFLVFRTYNLPERLGFGWDQERDARAATSILAGDVALIGPRVQGPMGFFLPPYFFYLIAPFYAITKGNPQATAIFVGFWSVLFASVSYLLISKIFTRKVALTFLAIWAINPSAIAMDTIAWNPVAIPLLVILMIYASNLKSLFWAGLVLGIGTSFHLQFIFMSLLMIPRVWEHLRNKKFSDLLKLMIGFLIPFLPVLIFDIRHNFLNTRLAFDFLGSQNEAVRILPVWDRVTALTFGINISRVVSLIYYAVTAYVLFILGKRKNIKIFSWLGIVWTFSLPLFYIFAKTPSEYYFNFLLPIPILAAAYLIDYKKIWFKILLAFVILFFAYRSLPVFYSVHFNLPSKDRAVRFLGSVTKDKDPFNVSFNVPANEDAGFRYLLDYHKVKYSGNPDDPLIEFVIPYNRLPTPFVFRDIGIFIPERWTQGNWVK